MANPDGGALFGVGLQILQQAVLPDEEESKKILDEADVPLYPVVTYPDSIMLDEERQAEVFARWREKWLATGVCTCLDGGSLVTKSLHEESLKRHIEDQD